MWVKPRGGPTVRSAELTQTKQKTVAGEQSCHVPDRRLYQPASLAMSPDFVPPIPRHLPRRQYISRPVLDTRNHTVRWDLGQSSPTLFCYSGQDRPANASGGQAAPVFNRRGSSPVSRAPVVRIGCSNGGKEGAFEISISENTSVCEETG